MVRLLAWLSGGLALLLVALAGLLALAVEDHPLVVADDTLSPAAISRARELLRRHDPRKLVRGETRKVDLGADDLASLLRFATRRGLHGQSALRLEQGHAEVRFTAPLPATPLGRYLNLTADLGVSDGRIDIDGVRIGRLPVPAPLFSALFDAYVRHTDLAPELALLRRTVTRVAIAPNALSFVYVWQPELLDSARDLAIGPTRRQRLADAHLRLVARMDAVAARGPRAPLADVLGPLLAGAGEAPAGGERSAAYRDALLVAAFHLSGKDVGAVIPEARQWPRPRPLTLTLRGREDLAQHFTVSAAVAAAGGEPLANAVGLDKEIDDSDHGSGFSFVDLAADRAGTRLGELAVRNPERLAAALAAGLTDSALLPPIDGLPEAMMAAEFRQRFGGPDAPAYRRMRDEIERRIAALALFR